MRTGAVIVAAGMSSRMMDFKPMMQLGPNSIIQRVIETLKDAKVEPIVVVTGHNAHLLEKHLAHLEVVCIHNPEYETTQMFDSAKLGLTYLLGKCDRVLFTPADIPLFSQKTVNQLLSSSAMLAKPVCGHKSGHPILLDASLLPELLRFKGEGGMKGALAELNMKMELIPVEDQGIFMDADTQEDYKKLLRYLDCKNV
jgi:CTP:molybdopterin cytidylyltransferase MocA